MVNFKWLLVLVAMAQSGVMASPFTEWSNWMDGFGKLGGFVRLAGSRVKVTQIAAGEGHTCAVGPREVKCWGDNTYGQLEIPSDLAPVRFISAGGNFTCALTESGVRCWGQNERGQTSVPTNLIGVQTIETGFRHACAIDSKGVKCWGDNEWGQATVPLDLTDFNSY